MYKILIIVESTGVLHTQVVEFDSTSQADYAYQNLESEIISGSYTRIVEIHKLY